MKINALSLLLLAATNAGGNVRTNDAPGLRASGELKAKNNLELQLLELGIEKPAPKISQERNSCLPPNVVKVSALVVKKGEEHLFVEAMDEMSGECEGRVSFTVVASVKDVEPRKWTFCGTNIKTALEKIDLEEERDVEEKLWLKMGSPDVELARVAVVYEGPGTAPVSKICSPARKALPNLVKLSRLILKKEEEGPFMKVMEEASGTCKGEVSFEVVAAATNAKPVAWTVCGDKIEVAVNAINVEEALDGKEKRWLAPSDEEIVDISIEMMEEPKFFL